MNYSRMYSSSQRASCTLSPPASSYQAQPPLGGDEGWFRKSETRPGNSERSRPNYYWLLAVRLRALRGCGRARKIPEELTISCAMAPLGKPPSCQLLKEVLCRPKQGAYPDS